jgi:hypothetical protein
MFTVMALLGHRMHHPFKFSLKATLNLRLTMHACSTKFDFNFKVGILGAYP